MTDRFILNGCALLDQDVSTALELSWALWTQGNTMWTSHTYSPADPAELDEFDAAEILLIVEKNIAVLDGESSIEILLSAADLLATEVMDRLNQPWPEDPTAPRPLQISLIDGALAWASGGGMVCRLGGLRTHISGSLSDLPASGQRE